MYPMTTIGFYIYFADFSFHPPFLEALAIGMIIATAIYLFTKNKWGSILLSVPFSALYMFVALRYSYHFVLVPIELGLQYVVINRIEKKTKIS